LGTPTLDQELRRKGGVRFGGGCLSKWGEHSTKKKKKGGFRVELKEPQTEKRRGKTGKMRNDYRKKNWGQKKSFEVMDVPCWKKARQVEGEENQKSGERITTLEGPGDWGVKIYPCPSHLIERSHKTDWNTVRIVQY